MLSGVLIYFHWEAMLISFLATREAGQTVLGQMVTCRNTYAVSRLFVAFIDGQAVLAKCDRLQLTFVQHPKLTKNQHFPSAGKHFPVFPLDRRPKTDDPPSLATRTMSYPFDNLQEMYESDYQFFTLPNSAMMDSFKHGDDLWQKIYKDMLEPNNEWYEEYQGGSAEQIEWLLLDSEHALYANYYQFK